jgi:hypothetical protein
MQLFNKRERKILLHISDPHTAHQLGLLNPESKIYKQTPKGLDLVSVNSNEVNEHLWSLWVDKILPEVVKFSGGDDIIAFITGDIVAGNKHTTEVITQLVSDQLILAKDVFKPLYALDNLRAVRFASGTPAHTFGNGSSEIMVADKLKDVYPHKDTGVVFHGLAEIRGTGIKIDYAHRGPYTGSRNWLRGNVARLYLQSLMQDEIDAGHEPPDLVLRGHFHTPVEESYTKRCNGHKYRSQIVVAPSMCILDDYARGTTQSTFKVTNGVFCFEIIDGVLGLPHEISETLDLRTKEELL